MTASVRQPSPEAVHTLIKIICKVPISFFFRLLQIENFTELRSFGFIVAETIGRGRKTAEISYDQFAAAANVTVEAIRDALESLARYGLINRCKTIRGRAEYSVRDEFIDESKAARVRGRCPDCQHVGEFQTNFVPTPHVALRTMGACVDAVTYKVVMVVILNSLKWNRQVQEHVWAEPADLDRNDFERLAGLSTREISAGIARAEALHLIRVEKRPGKPSRYWALPEEIAKLEKRAPRTVSRPKKGEQNGEQTGEQIKNETSDEVGQVNPKTQQVKKKTSANESPTQATESRHFKHGFCSNCGHFVDIEPEPQAETAAAAAASSSYRPESPPRAGPPPPFSAESPIGDTKSTAYDASPATGAAGPGAEVIIAGDARAESFEFFVELWSWAGVATNARDWDQARPLYDAYDGATRRRIVEYFVAQFKEGGRWFKQEFRPLPQNALKAEGWTRIQKKSIIPNEKMSRDEKMLAELKRTAKWRVL